MKSWVKYIFGITTAVVFLLSTSGFTIYSHHCSINGSNYSITTSPNISDCESCGNNEQSPSTSCCSVKQNCSSQSNTKNCCSDKEQFVKIDTDYNTPTHNDNPQPIVVSIFELNLIIVDNSSVLLLSEKVNNYSLPHPKTGSEFLIFISQLKTEPSPIA